MTLVSGRIPGARRPVTVQARLVDELGRPVTVAHVGGVAIQTVKRWRTAADGSWTRDMEANGGVLPASTRWEVTRRGDRGFVSYLDVPTAAGTVPAEDVLDRSAGEVVADPMLAEHEQRTAALEQIARAAPGWNAMVQAARADAAAARRDAETANARAVAAEAKVEALTARLAAVEAVPSVAAVLRKT